MKNVIGFIALITLLSGCGRSEELWLCDTGFTGEFETQTLTINFKKGAWGFMGAKAPFEENGDKVFSTQPLKDGRKSFSSLDRATGEYSWTLEDKLQYTWECLEMNDSAG